MRVTSPKPFRSLQLLPIPDAVVGVSLAERLLRPVSSQFLSRHGSSRTDTARNERKRLKEAEVPVAVAPPMH